MMRVGARSTLRQVQVIFNSQILKPNLNSGVAADSDIEMEMEIREIKKSSLSQKSRDVYVNAIIHFFWWLDDRPALRSVVLTEEFVNRAVRTGDDDDRKIDRRYIKDIISLAPENPPILLDQVNSKLVQQWIVSYKKASETRKILTAARRGKLPRVQQEQQEQQEQQQEQQQQQQQQQYYSHSTYNTLRAAIMHLFQIYNHPVPSELENGLSTFFSGLKKKIAREKGAGKGKVRCGKVEMHFSLYRFLCLRLLKMGTADGIFAWCYMVLSWNLMCRAGNTTSIRYAHMEWKDDCLGIYFAHMKNDQAGMYLILSTIC